MPGGDWCEDEVEGDPLGKKRGGMSQQFNEGGDILKKVEMTFSLIALEEETGVCHTVILILTKIQ